MIETTSTTKHTKTTVLGHALSSLTSIVIMPTRVLILVCIIWLVILQFWNLSSLEEDFNNAHGTTSKTRKNNIVGMDSRRFITITNETQSYNSDAVLQIHDKQQINNNNRLDTEKFLTSTEKTDDCKRRQFTSDGTITAIILRTRYPLSHLALVKIYDMANEIQESSHTLSSMEYKFFIMVDTTSDLMEATSTTLANNSIVNKTNTPKTIITVSDVEMILSKFFQTATTHRYQRNIQEFKDKERIQSPPMVVPTIPTVFSVNEELLLSEYPKWHSFLHNTPVPNINNIPGWCCGNSLMWLSLVPTLAMVIKTKLLKQHRQQHSLSASDIKQYKYVWCLEDDLDTIGSLSIVQLIQKWDIELERLAKHDQEGNREKNMIDLAAISLRAPGWLQRGTARHLHTPSFHEIVERMKEYVRNNNKEMKKQKEKTDPIENMALFDRETTPWTSMSDSIQRHSIRFAESVYDYISNNTYSWAETFVHPIAWDTGYDVVDLRGLQQFESQTEIGTDCNDENTNKAKQLVEFFRIDKHTERQEVDKQYGLKTRATTNHLHDKTVLFHGPTLAYENQWDRKVENNIQSQTNLLHH